MLRKLTSMQRVNTVSKKISALQHDKSQNLKK